MPAERSGISNVRCHRDDDVCIGSGEGKEECKENGEQGQGGKGTRERGDEENLGMWEGARAGNQSSASIRHTVRTLRCCVIAGCFVIAPLILLTCFSYRGQLFPHDMDNHVEKVRNGFGILDR